MKHLCLRKRLPSLAIDDFAFRKRDVYGTIVCDLRTNRPIALLNVAQYALSTRAFEQDKH